jgi:predicted metal-dependent HD superfamily phosphohydrolase
VEDITGWIQSLPFEWVQGCPESVFHEAREAYRSPGRHYHTWGHVEDCVEKLRTMPVESPRTVFLALVFHDAVYVPAARTTRH